MMELVGFFKEKAEFHAKNIIEEFHLQDHNPLLQYDIDKDKVIIKDDIVFKFACDYESN